jgi:anaerobic ribonucleoside-triphosphate reductase
MSTVIEMKGDRQGFKDEVETTDMALFVRTSDESMHDWDRQRIVDALIRETYVDMDTAIEIAREVEDLIATSNIKMITAPLIRELVDTKLMHQSLMASFFSYPLARDIMPLCFAVILILPSLTLLVCGSSQIV